MKQIKEKGISKFLKAKEKWLTKRRVCAAKRGIKYCDDVNIGHANCLKREDLIPMDLRKFKEFMSKI